MFEMLKTLDEIIMKVELVREALAGHERDCQFRLVNCVDLACQQRWAIIITLSLLRILCSDRWNGNYLCYKNTPKCTNASRRGHFTCLSVCCYGIDLGTIILKFQQ